MIRKPICVALLVLGGCSTYTISTKSLLAQVKSQGLEERIVLDTCKMVNLLRPIELDSNCIPHVDTIDQGFNLSKMKSLIVKDIRNNDKSIELGNRTEIRFVVEPKSGYHYGTIPTKKPWTLKIKFKVMQATPSGFLHYEVLGKPTVYDYSRIDSIEIIQ